MVDGTSLSAMGATSLGDLTHYNGIIFGGIAAMQADCEGALAVGGNATFGSPGQGYDVGAAGVPGWESVVIGKYDNPSQFPTFFLGGKMDEESTSARIYAGDVVLKSSYRKEYEAHAFQFETSVIHYVADETVDAFFAAAYTIAAHTSGVLMSASNVTFDIDDLPRVNTLDQSKYLSSMLATSKKILVYTIDCGKEDNIKIGEIGLGSYVNLFDAIIINAPAKHVTFTDGAILYNGSVVNTSIPRIYEGNKLISLLAAKLIFNFPNASTVTLTNYGLLGSLLAQNARVAGVGGSINGMLVAGSFFQDEGMELHALSISMGSELWRLEPKRGHVTIKKRDKDSKALLKGAEFTLLLQDEDGWYKIIATGTTDVSGRLTFNDLEPGKYKLVEDMAPWGYELPVQREWIFEITLNKEGELNELQTLYIDNTRAKGTATFMKVDYDNRETRLTDAKFSLYLRNEETGEYILVQEGLSTDNRGVLEIPDLLPGDYRLVETTAPAGYHLRENAVIDFAITLDDKGEVIGYGPADVPNQKLASVQLVKRDAENQEVTLPGAVYTLYKRNESTGIYEEITAGLITGQNGLLTITGLEPGEYRLTETAAPEGYYLEENANIFFSVKADQEGWLIDVPTINALNKLLGKVHIYKVDADDQSILLPDATFTLYLLDEQSGQYREYRTGLRTDAQGSLLIEGLEPGDYRLVETQSPHGYVLPVGNETKFTISL